MVKLLIADDHPVILNSLRFYFERLPQIKIEGTANNGFEALALLDEKEIDIVMLDIKMPQMDGIKCARQINYLHSNVKVIMFSGYADPQLVKRLMTYNIKGFLLKSIGMDGLYQALLAVSKGETYFDPQLDENIFEFYNEVEFQQGPLPIFSRRQLQVLKLICIGFNNFEIGEHLGISIFTIETFRQRIMKKSKRRNTADLVRWAYENEIVP